MIAPCFICFSCVIDEYLSIFRGSTVSCILESIVMIIFFVMLLTTIVFMTYSRVIALTYLYDISIFTSLSIFKILTTLVDDCFIGGSAIETMRIREDVEAPQ